MLEFKWTNLEEAINDFVKSQVEPTIRGLAATTWNGIMSKTPQYHGRLVASWSLSLNAPEFVDRSFMVAPSGGFDEFVGPLAPRWRGHHEAINIANSMTAGKLNRFQLGDTIWFANGADHGEGPYSSFIETISLTDPMWLRVYNRPGQAVSRTLDMIQARYGSGIPASAMTKLKTATIGASSVV